MDSNKAVNTLGQKCEMLDKSLNLNRYVSMNKSVKLEAFSKKNRRVS